MSAPSWNGVVVLILVLFACAEEPCRGNETNDVLAEKRLVEDPGGNFNWARYVYILCTMEHKAEHIMDTLIHVICGSYGISLF